ncbi:response regulator [Paenibacillus sp. EC2-1]|uniref:response regulator n=1 Tax=Paenibacillus sp. EC2-1 TaxID=3388665 RepID=UPI003BEF0D62
MHKVIVVDDEKYIRDRMVQFFPWDQVHFEVVGSAGNGREALDMVRRLEPHAVITDVLMPEMNGIELAKEIHIQYPSTKVIILSAYDDFKYAQEAIRYDVRGYLLKPLSKDDFLDTFSKLKEELKREAYLQDISVHKDEMLSHELRVLDLINGSGKDDEGEELLVGESRVMIFPLNRLFREQTISSLRQVIAEESFHFWKRFTSLCCLHGDNMIMIIQGDLAKSKEELRLLIGKYKTLLCAYTKTTNLEKETFVVGIGNIAKGTGNIKKSYNEAIYAYSYTFFYDYDTVIFFEDLPVNYVNEINPPQRTRLDRSVYHIEEKLIEVILQRDSNGISDHMDDYFGELRNRLGINITDIRGACTELIIVVMFLLKEKGYEPYSSEMQKKIEHIYLMETLSELKNWLVGILDNISRTIMTPSDHTGSLYVQKAKEYVSKHFNEKITLTEVSETLYLHPAYFSAIFKEETGQNFIDYINEVRVQKAAELLRKDEYRIKEISYIVGFQSESYFNRVFKKIKQISPLQYKKKFVINGFTEAPHEKSDT